MKAINSKRILAGLIILSCLVLINLDISAGAKDNIKDIELKLVQEVELKGVPDSKRTIFHSPITTIPIPKVDVFDKRIVFYDETGAQIAQKVYNDPIEVSSSENDSFFIVAIIKHNPDKKAQGNMDFEFFTERGEFLWSVNRKFPYDERPPVFFISNVGTVVEVRSDGFVMIYDNEGKLLNRVEAIEIAYYTPGADCKISFSENGNFIAVITSPWQLPAKSHVLLFDLQGIKRWEFNTRKKLATSNIFFSPDNKFLLTNHYSSPDSITTYIFDTKEGTLVYTLDNFQIYDAQFLKTNSRYLVLTLSNGRKELGLIDVEQKNYKPILEANQKILSISVAKKGILFAIIANNDTPHIKFFNLNGEHIKNVDLPKKCSSHKTFIKFINDNSLIIKNEERVFFYNISIIE